MQRPDNLRGNVQRSRQSEEKQTAEVDHLRIRRKRHRLFNSTGSIGAKSVSLSIKASGGSALRFVRIHRNAAALKLLRNSTGSPL